MARSRKFKCLVLVLSGFVGLQMTAADSNNSEADFVYPNGDKTTYHYGDTIEVQWTSIWPAPWLYTWCRFGKDEVIEGVQKQQVPTNGTQSIHMNFGDGNKCWFNLKEDEYSQHGNGVNSPSFQFKQNGGNNKIFAASTTMPPSSASTSTSTSTTGEASSVTATTTAKSSSGLSNGARIGIGVGVGLGVGGIALGAVGALLWARYRSRRRRGGGGKGSSSSSSRARRRSSSDHKEVRYQKAYPEAASEPLSPTGSAGAPAEWGGRGAGGGGYAGSGAYGGGGGGAQDAATHSMMHGGGGAAAAAAWATSQHSQHSQQQQGLGTTSYRTQDGTYDTPATATATAPFITTSGGGDNNNTAVARHDTFRTTGPSPHVLVDLAYSMPPSDYPPISHAQQQQQVNYLAASQLSASPPPPRSSSPSPPTSDPAGPAQYQQYQQQPYQLPPPPGVQHQQQQHYDPAWTGAGPREVSPPLSVQQLQQQQQTPVTVTDRQELDGSMPHELPARDSRLYPR